jgi:hypothetical protein
MSYAVEMGSGAMIYLPNFIKTGSDIKKLIGGRTYRQHSDRIILLFFQNTESTLKIGLKNTGRGGVE